MTDAETQALEKAGQQAPQRLPTQAPVQMFSPRSLREALEFGKMVAGSDLAPKQYRNKPGDVVVAIQWGSEIGLAPMQALQSIAVINGRATIWGDAALALAMAHPDYIDHEELYDEQTQTARCIVRRRGHRKPIERDFSRAKAVQAQLWGKQGPWTTYPERMLQLRARGFALRDAFPDAMRGLVTAEEARDYPEVVTREEKARAVDAVLEQPQQQPPPEEPEQPQRSFEDYVAAVAEMPDYAQLRDLYRQALRQKTLTDEQQIELLRACEQRTEELKAEARGETTE